MADCCSESWHTAREHSGGQTKPLLVPMPLDEALVTRVFEVLKSLMEPIPDGYVLPAQTILDDLAIRSVAEPQVADQGAPAVLHDSPRLPEAWVAHETNMEARVKTIVEYVTASNWSCCFEYTRNVIYNVRSSTNSQADSSSTSGPGDEDKAALVILRLMSFFWLDGQKLGHIIQELCSRFLYFRRTFQNTVAVITPLMITRWLDRYPEEFVQLHTQHKRLDGGADTLFDMTQTVTDNGRRKAILYPLLTTLLFLLPDVFEVASNLREAKSSNMAKKVAFLDGLRKALRNRNEQAGYCLVSLLRVARHFQRESDAALVSYALDVQDEVKEAVFRKFSAANDAPSFEQDMMTAAFVSLAHLNMHTCVDSLTDLWLASTAPLNFKIAVVQGCCYFARLPNPGDYDTMFRAAAPYMRGQLKVCSYSLPLQEALLSLL
jgi:neurofibromin 1